MTDNNHQEVQSRPVLSVLPNGMQVLVQEDRRFPLVVMRLYVRAGSSHERPDEAGISHVLEHMAFKKGLGENPGQAAGQIEKRGGSLNAATGFDQTVYMVDLPAESWAVGLESLYDLCLGPPAGEEELELEKEVILAELEKNEDNPRHRLFEQIQKMVWSGTGYARPIIGYRETIKALNLQKIKDYFQRVYLPQAMLLVVCGQVNRNKVLDKAERLFGNFYPEKTLLSRQRPFEPAAKPGKTVSVVKTSWKKGYLGLCFPAPSSSALVSPFLELASYILGGDTSSRYPSRYKYDQKLVDELGISPVLLEGQGMIYCQVQLDPHQVKPFWKTWLQDIAELAATPVTREELERAKLNLEHGLLQARETLAGMASKMGHFQFFEQTLAAEDCYLQQIRKAGLEEVQQAMLDTFSLQQMQGCFFLPRESGIEVADLESEPSFRQRSTPMNRRKKEALPADGQARVKELDRGCRLVLLPDPTLPYFGIDLTWLGGDQLLQKTEQGLAALTARTLTKGAWQKDAAAIRDFLSNRAASLEGMANRDQVSILAKSPSRFSSDLLGLLQDVVLEPRFDPDEVARSAFEQASRVIERTDHPLGLFSREIFPFLFPGHPYGFYHLGDPAGLDAFEHKDLKGFWQQQSTQPWVLSVCGDFDQTEIEETARKLQERSLRKGPALSIPDWSRQKELELEIEERNQAHILLVFPVPGLDDPLNVCTSLVKKLLAGQDGILFKELRDRQGLGYSVAPMLWTNPGIGFLGFYIGTCADKVEQAVSGFFKVIENLQQERVDPERLDRACNMLKAEYFRDRQGLLPRCSEASDLLSYGLPLAHHRNMIDKTRDIGPGEIQGFVREYLHWDRKYTMILRTRGF
ncbi:MAG: insulinase family protein [Desulfohalobiaceae bacterium]|nr:insulinase family protein [Desulfohalobiaceae bacterium]